MSTRSRSSVLVQGAPFLAFMLIGWYGLEQIVRSKRELRSMSKGLDAVEEMDPVERMRRRYGLDSSPGDSHGASRQERKKTLVPSLEEELTKTIKSIDLKDFEYKPVPRPKDDEW